MQFTTTIVALLAAAVSASPIADKRACGTNVFGSPAGLSVSKGSPQIVSFAITPPTFGPCSLEFSVPAGFPVSSSGNAQLNVIDVNGPTPGSIVGTVTLSSDPNQPTRKFINSFACRYDAPMAYRFEIAGEGAASVSFPAQAGAGLVINHSC